MTCIGKLFAYLGNSHQRIEPPVSIEVDRIQRVVEIRVTGTDGAHDMNKW